MHWWPESLQSEQSRQSSSFQRMLSELKRNIFRGRGMTRQNTGRRRRSAFGSVAQLAAAEVQFLEPRCLLSGNGLGTPSLAITKGVVSSSNDVTTFDAATSPASVQFAQPGSTGSMFQGQLTSELIRTGIAPISIDANALMVSAGDVLRIAVVVENQSTTGSAFDVTFRDTLPAGTTYVANSLTVVNGQGSVVPFVDLAATADGSGFFSSGIRLIDSTANDSGFATPDQCGALDVLDASLPGQNIALAIYEVRINRLAGSAISRTATASLTNFSATEQGTNLAAGVADGVSLQVQQVDLSVSTRVSNQNPLINDVVTWTVSVTNESANATSAATGVVVQDRLPAGYFVVAGSATFPAGGSFNEVTGIWTVGNAISSGQSVQFTFRTVVGQSAAAAADVVDLELESDFRSEPVRVGQTLSYTVTIRNDAEAATVDATGVSIGQLVPAGLSVVSATASIGNFRSATGIWDLTSSTLALGQAETITIVATVDSAAAGTDLQLNAEVRSVVQTDVDSTAGNASIIEDDDATGSITVLPAEAIRQVVGRVFNDLDGDGIDSSETGVAGIQVRVVDATGTVVGSAITDANGVYAITTATTGAMRLEFSGTASIQSVTTAGAAAVSSLAFIEAGLGDVTANLSVYQPDIQADLVTTCFVYSGQSTLDPSVEPAVIVFRKDGSVKRTLATIAEVGATNGLAVQSFSGDTFVAAFHKRHADIGPAGNSAIYRVTEAGAVSTFIRLDDVFGANFSGPISHNSADWFSDAPAFTEVGKVALGDLDVSDDGQFLYTINLATRELIQIPIGTGTSVSPVDYSSGDSRTVRRFAILGDDATAPTNGGIALQQLGVDAIDNIRPFAVHVVGDTVYVGLTNTAQTTDNTGDLRGYVFAFDVATGQFSSTAAADFPLGFRTAGGGWGAWTDDFNELPTFYDSVADNFAVGRPQPWLSDIEIDNQGDLILGFRDRTGDQIGHMVGDLTGADNDGNGSPDLFFHDTRGEILKLRKTNSEQWVVESGRTANDDSEFYFEDAPKFDPLATTLHPEAAQGALVQVPGFTDIVTTAIDPESFFAGGILALDNVTGQQTDQLDVYSGSSVPDIVTFGKNNGLGDLEYAGNLSLEIGNRVWHDLDRDGLQDADERGIAGVGLQLFDTSTGASILVGSTTTNASGEYLFNDTNVTYSDGRDSVGLRPLTDYEIRVATGEFQSGGDLDQFSLTDAHQHLDLVPATTVAVSGPAEFDSDADGTFDTARNQRLDVLSPVGLRADGVRVQVLNATGGVARVDQDGSIVFEFLDGSVSGSVQYSIVDDRIDSDALGFDFDGDGQTDSAFLVLSTGAAGTADHSFDLGFATNQVDVEVEKWVDQKIAVEGDVITYTVQVTNTVEGDLTAATGLSIVDVLPAGVTLNVGSVVASQGSFFGNVWTLTDPVEAGETATLRYQATINAGTVGSRLVGTAQVLTLDQADVDSSINNDDSDHSEDDEDDASTYVTAATSATAVNRVQVIAADQKDFDSEVQNDDQDQSEDDEANAALTISTNVNVFDFGDLPDQYGTLTASGGPAHRRGSPTFLGTAIDDESDGQPSPTASAEGSDDDGIRFLTPLRSGQSATIEVTVSTAGFLNAWIDFDSNGTLDEVVVTSVDGNTSAAGTTIQDLNLTAGQHQLVIAVPTATITTPAARFRVTSTAMGAARATGGVFNDGEVEDYVLRQLGDQVFYDQNANGLLDTATDFPLAGLTVTLIADLNSDNVVEQYTTTTDANGGYQFSGLPASSYTVSVATPTGTSAVFDLDAGNDGLAVVELAETVLRRADVDFGFRGTGQIGDTVWLDDNGDQVQQTTEAGIPGRTVSLAGDLNADSVIDVTFTTTTDQNGNYLFSDLAAGTYTLTVIPPAGVNATFDSDGLTTLNQSVANLASGEQLLDQDFGYRSTSTAASDVDLVVTKDNVNPRDLAAVGGIVDYIITVTNSGAADAVNAVITDRLPAEFISSTWTATGSLRSLFAASGTGNLNEIISLPAGATITYRVQAVLNSTFVGTISNTVTVTPTEVDPNPADNTATDVTSVSQLTLTPENTPVPGQPFQLGARGMSHVALLPFIVGTQLGPGIINGIPVDIADPEVFMVGFVCVDDRIIAVFDIPDLSTTQTLFFQAYESAPVPRLSNVIQFVSGGAQVLASADGNDVLVEGQANRQVQVRLNQQPEEAVRVLVQNDAPDRIDIDQPVLVFTPENWQQVQTVQVQAIDDTVSRRDISAAIRISVSDDDRQFADALEQQVTFLVVDNDDLTAPELNQSHQQFESGDVVIDWSASAGADSYDVWIAPTIDVQNTSFRGTVDGNQYVASTPLAIGKHSIWVRARSQNGDVSGWSSAGRIDVVTPTSVTAAAIPTGDRLKIVWDEVAGAETYEVWVNNRTSGQQRVLHRQDVTETELVADTSLQFGNHLIWVRAINQYGQVGKWSLAAAYNVGPVILQPQKITFDTTPTLEWRAVSGAATWEVFLRVGNDVIRQTGLTSNQFTVSEALPEGTYRWWVRGLTASGKAGGWSVPGEITVGGRPTVLTPIEAAVSNRPLFTWTTVDAAAEYHVYLIRLDVSSLILNQVGVTDSHWQVQQDLAAGSYRLWVRTVSQSGQASYWSRPVTFDVA
ncbi:MAG: SdrD B-like domain-containing protein [Fuerstiella sp.]